MRTWWSGLGRGWRLAALALALVLAVNVVVTLLGEVFGRPPGGPRSSSYATAPEGVAAWARLLERAGHDVDPVREPLADADLAPSETLVLADPVGLVGDDAEAVEAFVRAGGRLVASGPSTIPVLRRLVGEVRWEPEGPARATIAPGAPEGGGASVVRGDGDGSWSAFGDATPFLGTGDRVLGFVADVGAGRVVGLADTSPWWNEHLDEAGNAGVGLAVAGDTGRRVRFDEAGHGYGGSGSFLPDRWWWAVAFALVAVLLGMWSLSRRLGPPEEAGRELPPRRREYVDALAVPLSRSGEPAVAVAALQARARARLTQRLGLPPEAGKPEVAAAAARAGLPAEDVDALFDPPRNGADVVEVGRAAARHGGGTS